MKRRIEITVETERILTVARRNSNPILWCERCAGEVQMLTVDQAAARSRSTSRAIFRLAEAGNIHCEETPEGRLYICPNSI